MSGIKHTIARKAVKATAKHTVHGTASKLKRDRVRVVTLVGVGGVLGGVAGWLAGRSAAATSAGVGS
jgi:membrane protein YqaA with SNARE-associated domain